MFLEYIICIELCIWNVHRFVITMIHALHSTRDPLRSPSVFDYKLKNGSSIVHSSLELKSSPELKASSILDWASTAASTPTSIPPSPPALEVIPPSTNSSSLEAESSPDSSLEVELELELELELEST